MDTRNRDNAKKFREPRSWAARWCGHGLPGTATQPRAEKGNAGGFREPRGWSVKWSGGGLFRRREQ